ncbi:universal stress protein [Asinibacterium sp. OR53]|uniref:universal stress protein n=1 Tax=Asinibacterium sp. OR53 TaxID=925409 RepID=UPI000478A196|nr:universal stress protein [Asinibacterium sp. OR53]
MKKIIVAFDGLRFSESVRDYAIELANQSNAHLVGVFLDDFMHHSYKIQNLITENKNYHAKQKELETKDVATRKEAVKNFEIACQEAGLQYNVHHDRNVAIQELLRESIYADLLMIDNTETLTAYTEKIPSEFIGDLLSRTKCPVLMVPHHFKPIDKIVLLYNGDPSSVYAIKMFSYILSSLKEHPTEVVSVKGENESSHLPNNALMKEFMKRHFPEVSYTILKGSAETEIRNYLKRTGNYSLVILGAYGRGMISNWLRPSMADMIMKELQIPLFIAHAK